MQEDINLIIENFKNSIVQMVNENNLPPAVVYYIFKDVFKDIETSYTNYLNQVRKQQKNEQIREALSTEIEPASAEEIEEAVNKD